MEQKTKILLVEDDLSMGFLLVDFLESNSFDVKLYRDGASGWNAYQNGAYDFCILDVMLPKIDGFQIAEKIRKNDKRTPIIFLTARSMKHDKLKGFSTGIDDYITKPFDEDELICRIHAILNRSQQLQTQVETTTKKIIEIGQFSYQPHNLLLQFEDNHRRLTPKENEVLQFLCNSKNNIVKRDDLLIKVWGDNDYFHGRSLDVFIAKLRKYLSSDTNVSIESIPKVGYILRG